MRKSLSIISKKQEQLDGRLIREKIGLAFSVKSVNANVDVVPRNKTSTEITEFKKIKQLS